MPPAVIGAAIIGTAGVASAAISSSAAKKAANASQAAADQTAEVQREALNTAQANTATSRAAGNLATNALAARFGLIPTGSTLGAGNIYSGAAGAAPSATTGVQSRTGVISDVGFGGYRADSSPSGNVYTSATPYSATTAAGTPNWGSYETANPDVVDFYNTHKDDAATLQAMGLQPGASLDQFVQAHYDQFGKTEGRTLPTVTADQAAAAAPQTDVQLSPAAQVPTYTRSADIAAPAVYTPTNYAAPTYTRPDYAPKLDVSIDGFQASPEALAAQNAFKTLANGSNAAFSATGGLQSGAAMKALADRAADNEVNYYGQFANRTTNQYNTDRNRFDTNYNFDTNLDSGNKLAYSQLGQQDRQYGAGLDRSDYEYGQNRSDNIFNLDRAYGTDMANNNRAYETSRYDAQTGNLFNLANLGSGAAAQSNGAAQNYANGQSQNLFSNAANQGNAALAGASNISGLIGSGASALGYYFGNQAKVPTAATASVPASTNIYALGGGY